MRFFFQGTETTEIYTLSLHDALPIFAGPIAGAIAGAGAGGATGTLVGALIGAGIPENRAADYRSEEHTSELQSQSNLVCRLLLEKKKQQPTRPRPAHVHHP